MTSFQAPGTPACLAAALCHSSPPCQPQLVAPATMRFLWKQPVNAHICARRRLRFLTQNMATRRSAGALAALVRCAASRDGLYIVNANARGMFSAHSVLRMPPTPPAEQQPRHRLAQRGFLQPGAQQPAAGDLHHVTCTQCSPSCPRCWVGSRQRGACRRGTLAPAASLPPAVSRVRPPCPPCPIVSRLHQQ